MKKLILSSILALGLVSYSANAATLSYTVSLAHGATTNILSGIQGLATVNQVILTATTATNTSVLVVDTLTNALTYTVPAYTNTVSYSTNIIYSYTNFYGSIETLTNNVLIDLTNNAVASQTVPYPTRLSLAALANTSVATPSTAKYTFLNGIFITNNAGTLGGDASVTIVYTR